MKASHFSDVQKAFIIKNGENGTPVAEICRKGGWALVPKGKTATRRDRKQGANLASEIGWRYQPITPSGPETLPKDGPTWGAAQSATGSSRGWIKKQWQVRSTGLSPARTQLRLVTMLLPGAHKGGCKQNPGEVRHACAEGQSAKDRRRNSGRAEDRRQGGLGLLTPSPRVPSTLSRAAFAAVLVFCRVLPAGFAKSRTAITVSPGHAFH